MSHPDNSRRSLLYSKHIAHDHALESLLEVIDTSDSDSQGLEGILVRSLITSSTRIDVFI